MAEYQIVYWRDIPSMVTARAGRSERASVELPELFQQNIDEAAMRAGLGGQEGYLAEWRRSSWLEGDGTPQELAAEVAARLISEYPVTRLQSLARAGGLEPPN
jgi:hypothetical protein